MPRANRYFLPGEGENGIGWFNFRFAIVHHKKLKPVPKRSNRSTALLCLRR